MSTDAEKKAFLDTTNKRVENAAKLVKKVVQDAWKKNRSVPTEHYGSLTIAANLYLSMAEEGDEDLKKETFEALESIVSDWSWAGQEFAAVSFWDMAVKHTTELAQPVAKELLEKMTKAALSAAKSKVEGQIEKLGDS